MKTTKILLILLVAMLILAVNAFAVETSIPGMTGDAEATVDIPVNIDNAAGVAGYQFKVTYDPATLNCTTALRGSLTGGFDSPTNNLATPGAAFTLSLAPDLTPLTGGSGSLAIIRCKVVGSPGATTSLHLEPASALVDSESNILAATYVDGTLAVTINLKKCEYFLSAGA